MARALCRFNLTAIALSAAFKGFKVYVNCRPVMGFSTDRVVVSIDG